MDDVLKAKLDATGLNYKVDDDGDGRLLFQTTEDRSQIVWIDSKKDKFSEYEDWDIFSYVADVPEGDMSGPEATFLLKKNGTFKAGNFMIRGTKLMFKLEVSCDISPNALKDALVMIAHTADKYENIMNEGGDTF